MAAGVDEMIKTFQGHFQQGRFVSSQAAAIPEYVEVLIVVTDSPIAMKNAQQKIMEDISRPKNATNKSRLLREPDSTKPGLLGCMAGLAKIPEDFDEPLEELKDYMY
jgi:hypothetical protein